MGIQRRDDVIAQCGAMKIMGRVRRRACPIVIAALISKREKSLLEKDHPQ